MEWEYSGRDISLKKIFYIVENFYDNDVNIYLMLHPQCKELLEKLKRQDGLTFCWAEDLETRGGLYYSAYPSWVGLFRVDELISSQQFEDIYFMGDGRYPIGAILVTRNQDISGQIRQPYLESLDGCLLQSDFEDQLLANGGILAYSVTVSGDYRDGDTDEFTFVDDALLKEADLFLWSKVVLSFAW